MASKQVPDIDVKPASGISYFTPAQEPPAGTAADPQSDEAQIPKLFRPLKVRGLTLHNRIGVCPPFTFSLTPILACSVSDNSIALHSCRRYVNTPQTMAI